MNNKKRISVLVLSYNAERTIESTLRAIPYTVVDSVLVCDDGSTDQTVCIVQRLGVECLSLPVNQGAGNNTKQGFNTLLARGNMDIIVLLHGDNQYDPACIPRMIQPLLDAESDVVLGNRIEWIKGNMPAYKQWGNMFLTWVQNRVYNKQLCDYATGYKAFNKNVLRTINYQGNKSDFEFDAQLNAQIVVQGYRIKNCPVPTRYFPEARSVGIWTSCVYGMQTLRAVADALLYMHGIKTKRTRMLFEKSVQR